MGYLTRQRTIPIRYKLFFTTIFLGTIMAAIVLMALSKINSLREEIESNIEKSSTTIEFAFRIKEQILELRSVKKDIILSHSERELLKHLKILELKKIKLRENLQDLKDSVSKLDSVQLNLIHKVPQLLASWDKESEKLVSIAKRSILKGNKQKNLSIAHELDLRARELSKSMLIPISADLEAIFDNIVRTNFYQMRAASENLKEDYLSARWYFSIIALAGIFIGVLASYLIGQSISQDLKKLSTYALRVSRTGELEHRLPKLRDDEIGELGSSFDIMRLSIHQRDQELLEINQKLFEKNQEVEQFVYTVSHDLKSPLVTALGFIGFMGEDLAEGNLDGARDAASRIGNSCQKMSTLIDDLLSLSRIGASVDRFETISMDDVLAELESRYQQKFEERGAILRVGFQLPEVFGSRNDIERAVDNLISNALKYACNEPNAQVEVGGSSHEGRVEIFVRDTGPGISPEFHENIFSLFKRLDTDAEGTGLGLASVKKIMGLHRGEVRVESQIGQGATFWLSFPPLGS